MTRKFDEKSFLHSLNLLGNFKLSSEIAQKDIAELKELIKNSKVDTLEPDPIDPRPSFWHNTAAKMAIAAVLIAAFILCLHTFYQEDLTATELLKRVSTNASNFPCVKSTTQNIVAGSDNPPTVDVHYSDYNNKQIFTVFNQKYIHQWDFNEMIHKIYRPEDNTLIIEDISYELTSPETEINEYIEKLQSEGLVVSMTKEKVDGQPITTIEYSDELINMSPDPDKYMSNTMRGQHIVKTIRTKLTVNRDQMYLKKAERSYYDPQGKLIVTTITQSSPIEQSEIPADIYALGASKDATVDNRARSRQVKDIRNQILTHQKQFLNNYIAVQTEIDYAHDEPSLMETMAIYAKGEKLRVDVLRRTWPSDKDNPVSDEIENLLKQSIDYATPYVFRPLRLSSLRIYDGLWQHELDEHDNKLILNTPERRPDGDKWGDDDLADFGWRTLWLYPSVETMFTDEYAKENKLLAMQVTGTEFSPIPTRKRLYVDPAKDYLFKQYIVEKLVDPDWQTDQSWLDKVANKKMLREEVRKYEITEYGQTTSGQWYPKEITITGYDRKPFTDPPYTEKYHRVRKLYLLEENPDLPDSFFDKSQIENLNLEK